jgi:tRNA nucleotidyltransferase (CCA-adding enzyme)
MGEFMSSIEILKDILLRDDIIDSVIKNEDIIFKIIPELKYEKDFDQKSEWHCYDVWKHTINTLVLSDFNLEKRLILLLHDIGKPFSFQEEDGSRRFHGHARKSAEISLPILKRLDFEGELLEKMLLLIDSHASKIIIEDINYENIDFYKDLIDIQICDASAYEPNHYLIVKDDLNAIKNYILDFNKKKETKALR